MRIIVAMTGATGAVSRVRLLAAFRKLEAETCLVLNRWTEIGPTKRQGLPRASAQSSGRRCLHATSIQNPPMTSSILQSIGRMQNLSDGIARAEALEALAPA